MGYGLWAMGYGLWAMGYGLWAMGYGLTRILQIPKKNQALDFHLSALPMAMLLCSSSSPMPIAFGLKRKKPKS